MRLSFFIGTLLLLPVLAPAKRQLAPEEHALASSDKGEARIAQEIRHQLIMLPYYGIFDDLAFRVDGAKVTLLGAVTRPVLKSDAENTVKRVEGIASVQNEIEVLPLSPDDDRIRLAEFRIIYGDPAIGDRYGHRALPPIHIIVKNGHVTLVGAVASEADKNLLKVRANTVPGVFSVTNKLQVEQGPTQ
jgi:hyperosmotically inducible periplasmic protein